MRNTIILPFMFLMIISSGCSAQKRLKVINGELDACLLVSTAEVESISGVRVNSEHGFVGTAENNVVTTPTICRYFKESGEVLMVTFAETEVTLFRKGYNYYEPSEFFLNIKTSDIGWSEKYPTMWVVEEIDGLGEQAYARIGDRIYINVLRNDLVYSFDTAPIEDGGMGYDPLFELATIALQRAP